MSDEKDDQAAVVNRDRKVLTDLNNANLREESGLLPGGGTIENKSELDGEGFGVDDGDGDRNFKMPVRVDDEEAVKAALPELDMEHIKSKSAFVGAVNDIVAEQTGQLNTIGSVPGPDDNRHEYAMPAWEDNNRPEGLDAFSGNGVIKVGRPRYEKINNDEWKEAVKSFVDEWGKKGPGDELVVKLSADMEGKLWVDARGTRREEQSFPVWMLALAMGVSKERTPESSVPNIMEGAFNDIHRNEIGTKWQKLLGRLEIEGKVRPKIRVELTGPWKKKEQIKVIKKEADGGNKVMVDLDLLGEEAKRNGVRKRVARVVGLMEMQSDRPSFAVGGKTGSEGWKVDVRNKGQIERVDIPDLMKVMPKLGRNGGGTEYWSNGKLSVDVTSSPEEWEKFLESIKIEGRVKRPVGAGK